MTAVRRTLASALGVFSASGSSRKNDVVIRVMVRSRGGMTLDINEGEVVMDLSEPERVSLIEAMGGEVIARRRDSGCSPNEGTV